MRVGSVSGSVMDVTFIAVTPSRLLEVKSCTDTVFCTRTGPDPTDTFKNMINFSRFYFIKNIKNIERNSIFSSTPMDDESLNHHQIHMTPFSLC
jgi:hypothetical protein